VRPPLSPSRPAPRPACPLTVRRSRRKMASTGANVVSSRSHAILQMIVEQRPRARAIVDEVCLLRVVVAARCLTRRRPGPRGQAVADRPGRLRARRRHGEPRYPHGGGARGLAVCAQHGRGC
jgi:hypothetical protein